MHVAKEICGRDRRIKSTSYSRIVRTLKSSQALNVGQKILGEGTLLFISLIGVKEGSGRTPSLLVEYSIEKKKGKEDSKK